MGRERSTCSPLTPAEEHGMDRERQKIAPWSQRLDDMSANRAFAAGQLVQRSEIIEQSADRTIFRTREMEGWILIYDVGSRMVVYAVQYRTCRWSWMCRTVTQCIVWRNAASRHVAGMTQRIFFGYLLETFGTVMSDSGEVPSGYDFWRARMNAAIDSGLQVGIADVNARSLSWFDPAGSLRLGAWVRQHNGYGPTRKPQAVRYLISSR
jgi:hypothetical protein